MQGFLFSMNQVKGFVFSLEALIAVIIFASFIQIAYFNESVEKNYLDEFSFRDSVSNSLIVLDENGAALEVFDSNLSNSEKAGAIYDQVKSLLPKNAGLFIKISAFDTNSIKCAETRLPEDCFLEIGGFNELGPSPPLNKNVEHSQIVLASKLTPEECRIEAVFSPYFSRENKLFFGEKKAKRIFFEEEADLNIFFDVNSTPSDEAMCGQDIKVDMNAFVPDYTLLYGRKSADIALILDRSGSMNDILVSKGLVAANTLSGGTFEVSAGSCTNYSNWQNLGTFNVDANLAAIATSLIIRMTYSGYAGLCGNPRLRVRNPSGTYLPSSSGSAGSSGTANVTINAPLAQGVYTIEGWSDESINYDANLLVYQEYTASNTVLNSGSFSGGRKNGSGAGCFNFRDWDNLYSLNVNASLASATRLNLIMRYTGYSGECLNPRLRIITPSDTYLPNQNGQAGSGGTATVSINSPITQGNYSIQGWSDDLINYDLNLQVIRTNLLSNTRISNGSFNDGNFGVTAGGCTNYGSWVNIGTYVPDANTVNATRAQFSMRYSGYTGLCSYPRFRVLRPNGTYAPSSSGSGTSSTINIILTPLSAGTYTLQGWSDSSLNVDVNLYLQKLFVAKKAANNFVDYNGWKSQYDQMSLVSFSTTALVEQQLVKMTDGNKTTIKNKVNALTPSGNTAIGDAITLAKNELISARATPDSIRFEVLLSDGQSNTGSDPMTAAQGAKDNNIKVYTIGFGIDADHNTLNNIAELTGGKYYRADDQNGLSEVFELIAIDIGENLEIHPPEIALDTNLMIPITKCDYITQTGSGICADLGDGNYLYYLTGDINKSAPWSGSFTINVPCDSTDACSFDKLIVPFPGTKFYWRDSNNNLGNPIDFDKNISLNFKYRDLSVNILSAYAIGTNIVALDVNSKNSGKLDTNSTTVDFLINDPYSGVLVKQENVEALSPGGYKLLLNERLNASNWIYAVINRDEAIKECPGNNIASVYCGGAKKNKFYVIDVWTWLD